MWVVLTAVATVAAARLSARNCAKPPENGFISAQQMDFICEHRKHWMKERDEMNSWKDTTMAQWKYLRNIESCTRENCVKYARRKKRETEKSIRKEIRMLTPEERDRLFRAMNALKIRMIDNITAWDLHTLVHYPDSAPGAHWGPAFLPWHREFLRQFEIALQQEEPSVTLPYWDSTLDQGQPCDSEHSSFTHIDGVPIAAGVADQGQATMPLCLPGLGLPDPADSILFTDEILGNGNGYVKTGPFKDWDTNVLMPLSSIPVKKLYRSTGGRDQDRLMNPNDVDWIVTRQNYSQLTFCHDKTFESIHGLSHVWVGGFMFVIRVSPNDPMFYMHHAFVDYLWEQFRRRSQSREERETQWATDTCNSLHGYDAQMKPFMIQNRDGLSNQYTDEWYDYQAVRHCTPTEAYCDSPLYWCDVATWRCRSKIVLGGNCTGYEGQPICYNSVCQKGRCQAPPRVTSRNIREEVDHFPVDTVWAKTVLLDAKGKGLDSELAKVTVFDASTETNRTTYKEPNTRYPELPGIVYLPLPKPRAGMLRNVTLDARDAYGRYCQAHCYNSTAERYQVCQPTLSIGYRAETSSPIAYTHSFSSRRFLDVDLSRHPREMAVSMPFMVFACSRKMVTSVMITSLAQNFQPIGDREEYVWLRVNVNRKDTSNLQIEATSDNEKWSSSVRRAASSFDPNIVFVQAPNPARHPQGVRLQVSILEDGRKANCKIKCTAKDGSVRSCDGSMELHSEPARSQEAAFSSDPGALALLGWDMRGHPQHWRHQVPYLAFFC